jgi:hypothetical protein
MATTKKTSKKVAQKVRAIVQADVFKSIATASVLLNILFLVTVVVLTSSSTFDHKLYTSARERYCNNAGALKSRAHDLGDANAAATEWQINCISKNFEPFYNEAIEKFEAQNKQN